MAKYRVLEESFINNSIAAVDEIVEYDGEPSDNLELVEDVPPAKSKKPADASA